MRVLSFPSERPHLDSTSFRLAYVQALQQYKPPITTAERDYNLVPTCRAYVTVRLSFAFEGLPYEFGMVCLILHTAKREQWLGLPV